MDFQLWNPFSSRFLQVIPDKAQTREKETKLNSYGVGEDTLDLGKLIRGYSNSSTVTTYPFEQNNIVFDTLFTTKRQRVNWYRTMSNYSFVKKLINIICNECVAKGVNGEMARLEIDPAYRDQFTDYEYNSLVKEFNYIINAVLQKNKLKKLFRKWLIDGELFLEVCLNDEGDCIAGVKALPPYCTLCVYNEGILTGFVQDPSLISPEHSKNEIKTFTRNQIAYSNYGVYGNNLNDVKGHLEAAIRPVNMLRALQDAQNVYFQTRAPEKRIWKIAAGGKPAAQQQEYLQQCIYQYRQDLRLDPHTGLVNGAQNTQALTQDFWFTTDRNGQGSTVETFQGGQTLQGLTESIQSYREEVADAMEVPGTRWKGEPGSSQYVQGVEGLSIDESSFQLRCDEWASDFAEIIKQLLIVQLQVAGYDEKYLDNKIYNISLIPATDTTKYREMALAEKRAAVLGSVATMMPTRANIKDDGDEAPPMFATNFVLGEMCGYSTEQLMKNRQSLENEIAEMRIKAEAAKEEGGDDSEDGGDDGDMDF